LWYFYLGGTQTWVAGMEIQLLAAVTTLTFGFFAKLCLFYWLIFRLGVLSSFGRKVKGLPLLRLN